MTKVLKELRSKGTRRPVCISCGEGIFYANTISQAAEWLDVNESTVRRAMKTGRKVLFNYTVKELAK